MANRFPWFKFFVDDWRGDTKLSACQHPTRSIWLEANCAMHVSDTDTLEGSPEQLSRILRCTVAELHSAVSDLNATGAADVMERNGIIILSSRRRKRELDKRLMNRERVRKFRSNAECPSGSGSDSDSSGIPGNGDARGKGPDDGDLPYTFDASELPDALKTPEFALAWPLWVAHRARKPSTRLNRRSARMQLKNLGDWGSPRAVAAIEHSVAGAYQGIFEPKTAGVAKAAPKVSAETISAIAAKHGKGPKS